jgi:hypothetical protein
MVENSNDRVKGRWDVGRHDKPMSKLIEKQAPIDLEPWREETGLSDRLIAKHAQRIAKKMEFKVRRQGDYLVPAALVGAEIKKQSVNTTFMCTCLVDGEKVYLSSRKPTREEASQDILNGYSGVEKILQIEPFEEFTERSRKERGINSINAKHRYMI